MADGPENHTVRLPGEMREEMRGGFAEMRERLDGMDARLDGPTHIVTLLVGHWHGLEERQDPGA